MHLLHKRLMLRGWWGNDDVIIVFGLYCKFHIVNFQNTKDTQHYLKNLFLKVTHSQTIKYWFLTPFRLWWSLVRNSSHHWTMTITSFMLTTHMGKPLSLSGLRILVNSVIVSLATGSIVSLKMDPKFCSRRMLCWTPTATWNVWKLGWVRKGGRGERINNYIIR